MIFDSIELSRVVGGDKVHCKMGEKGGGERKKGEGLVGKRKTTTKNI